MSHTNESRWQLQREYEIRQQARRVREAEIKQSTEIYLRRYEQALSELENEGLAEFVEKSITNIRNEIRHIRSMNAYDGRNHSLAIEQVVQMIRREALENKRIAEEYQRLLHEEALREAERLKAAQENAWLQAIDNWENKLARNLAFKPLAELHRRIAAENWAIVEIQQAVAGIKQTAELQAAEIQQGFTKTVQKEAMQTQKAELLEIIETADLPSSQSERLKQKIKQADQNSLLEIAKETCQAQDTAIEDEAVRKEMVKAVYQSLKQAGFTVLPPVKQGSGDDNVVLVQACRPQGNQAKFRVSLNGSVRYEFDNYIGQRCKEDMKKVLPRLSEVYGVNLSNERVIWENPDDEHADAKPINPIHTTKLR